MPLDDFPITADIDQITRADRALVYLAVDWSIPERRSRAAVLTAVAALGDINFEVYAVQEDGRDTGPWLGSYGWPEVHFGYGSLIWMERGRVVAKELLPGDKGPQAVIVTTRSLWGHGVIER